MKKREFLSLVKSLYEDMRRNIRDKADEVRSEGASLYTEISLRAEEVAKKKVKEGSVDFKNGHVWVSMTYDGPKEIKITLPFSIKDEKLEELIAKLKECQTEVERLTTLASKFRTLFTAWKLRAIENKTYNKEPFPKELIEFVSDEFKDLLVVKE